MVEVGSRPAGLSTQRWLRVAFPLLATLSGLFLGVAVLLALSPLNELPDTACQTVLDPPHGAGCSDIISRRWHWIAWILVAAVVLAVLAALARRRGLRRMNAARLAAVALMLASVGLGLTAGWYLTVGKNSDDCGSTLSRVDEHGDYSPDRPKMCASSYADSRAAAWTFGLLGLAVFLTAGGIEVREEARAQRAESEAAPPN
ncbi:MAG TPA: hypothetical protein VE442_23560 [Jatrophihabitans sp.]|nr:hypothetical protein [Jatrophihabitans sp.]